MNQIFFSPIVGTSAKERSSDFWENLNSGVLVLDEKDQDLLPAFPGLKNSGSATLKMKIEDFCTRRSISEIPSIVKVKAILFLEQKFRTQSNNPEGKPRDRSARTFQMEKSKEGKPDEMSRFQEDFIKCIKKEIARENRGFGTLITEKKRSWEEKFKRLEGQKLRRSEDSRQMKALLIHFYYYYLARYNEFLTQTIFATNEDNESEIIHSDRSSGVIKSDKNIEQYLEKYRHDVEERKVVNYPETIFDLIKKCKNDLDVIKSDVGIHHENYLKSSINVVYQTTSALFDIVENPVKELLTAQIPGLKLGKTLLEECQVAMNEIGTIEMDTISRNSFSNRKKYFDRLVESLSV